MSKGKLVHLDGRLVPLADARISVDTPALKYGAAVFEGIRAYWNDARQQLFVFRLHEHLVRLKASMRVMGMDDPYTIEGLTAALMETITANGFRETIHLRAIVYVGGDGEVSARGPCGITIMAVARPPSKTVQDGMHCQVSSWRRIDDTNMPPRIKTIGNYVNSRLALQQARSDGYDSAVLLNSHGKIAEGPTSCLFMVRDGRLITPSVSAGLLESITRDTIIRLAEEATGHPAVEREIDRTELYLAEEAFLCGSGPEIVPVVSVDRRPLGAGTPGPLTRRVQALYFDAVHGRRAVPEGWLTPVYG